MIVSNIKCLFIELTNVRMLVITQLFRETNLDWSEGSELNTNYKFLANEEIITNGYQFLAL